MEKGEEKKRLNLEEIIETKEDIKETENKPKSKQSQLYFYIPLILSSFSYMCQNSLNYMIQIDSEYIIKINTVLESSKLDKNKSKINHISQYLIISILFINILSKSLGHLILNTKFFKNKIDILLIISNIISLFTNALFFIKKTSTKFIFFTQLFNAFTSGVFCVTLLRLNWSFLPLNEGLVSGVFSGFEYFSLIYLALFYKIMELKYLFLVNSIFLLLSLISIFFIIFNFKGFYSGKSSDLEINLEHKEKNDLSNNINNDKNLEENLIKTKEEGNDIKNDIKEEHNEKEDNEEKIEQFETDNKDEENSVDNNEKFSLFIQNLYADISSYRFILLIITYFLLLFSNYILSLIYQPFSIIFNLHMYFNSSNQLIIYVLIYFISSIFFGISFDLKMVRTLVIRLIFLSVFTIILFFPTKYFSYFIDLLSLLNAICLSGIKSIIYPLVYREFFNNEENYYLISIFLFVEIIIYVITPFILKMLLFDLADFIMIFITCMGMLFGGYYIMTKKLFPLIIIDTNDSYDINTKKGQGLKQLHLQDELPPLSKE